MSGSISHAIGNTHTKDKDAAFIHLIQIGKKHHKKKEEILHLTHYLCVRLHFA